MSTKRLAAVMQAAGIAATVAGAWLIIPGLAVMTVGLLAIALGWALERKAG